MFVSQLTDTRNAFTTAVVGYQSTVAERYLLRVTGGNSISVDVTRNEKTNNLFDGAFFRLSTVITSVFAGASNERLILNVAPTNGICLCSPVHAIGRIR